MDENTTAPKRLRRKTVRPGEFVVAALELFVQQWLTKTRMEDIAMGSLVDTSTVNYKPTPKPSFTHPGYAS